MQKFQVKLIAATTKMVIRELDLEVISDFEWTMLSFMAKVCKLYILSFATKYFPDVRANTPCY